jgi:peptidyl-prolyl cis-trans isomerase SurA
MLGEFTPGMMVKAFDDVVFSMREGEVSDVFESEYGYHIIMLHKRQGQVVTASHILKIPSRSVDGDSTAIDSLGRIRARIVVDSLTFEQAAIRYSEDRATKDCGGCISNPKTGDLRIPMDLLDSDLFFKVDEMKPGEISQPMEYRMPDGTNAFHLLYLHKKIPPHEPNLEDDYKKIHTAALQAKQAELFEKWLIQAKENIFIDIKPTECGNALRPWLKQ